MEKERKTGKKSNEQKKVGGRGKMKTRKDEISRKRERTRENEHEKDREKEIKKKKIRRREKAREGENEKERGQTNIGTVQGIKQQKKGKHEKEIVKNKQKSEMAVEDFF